MVTLSVAFSVSAFRSRTTNKILKQYLRAKGIPDCDIEEIYTPFGHTDYQTIVAAIKKFAAGGKACVISTPQRRHKRPVLQGVRERWPDLRELSGRFILDL